MNRSRAELKEALMRQAELAIDQLLEFGEHTAEPTLTQIEDVVLKLRKPMSEQMALTLIEAQANTRPAPGPRWPTCQREMHSKDMKGDTVESRVGVLPLKRSYYYCETCRSGLFPPGSAVADLG